MTEYRVVRTDMFGTFKCFDSDKTAALKFLTGKPPLLGTKSYGDTYELQARPVGAGPKDWAAVPYNLEALFKEMGMETRRCACGLQTPLTVVIENPRTKQPEHIARCANCQRADNKIKKE